MDVEPPVGDDLNRMLVSMKQQVLQRAAAEPPAKPRPWARRHLGLTLGLVALLGIGGASGALALVLPSPFEAAAPASPTSTPEPSATPRATATPTFTPTAPEQDPVPRPAYDVDCATLGDQIGVDEVVPGASVEEVPLAPYTAEYLQEGALRCTWVEGDVSTSGPLSGFSVTIVPQGPRGREWISGLRQSGLSELGVGDASAVACDPDMDRACRSSVVVGPWWMEVGAYDFRAASAGGYVAAPTADTLRPAAAALAGLLEARTPPAPWRVPTSTWGVTGCDGLPSAAALAPAVGAGPLDEPTDQLATDAVSTGIELTQLDAPICTWVVQDQQLDGLYAVEAVWADGAAWALRESLVPGTPVTVAGAEDARGSCSSEVGRSGCVIDMVVADTWVRVFSQSAPTVPDGFQQLVPAAEVIAAARRG